MPEEFDQQAGDEILALLKKHKVETAHPMHFKWRMFLTFWETALKIHRPPDAQEANPRYFSFDDDDNKKLTVFLKHMPERETEIQKESRIAQGKLCKLLFDGSVDMHTIGLAMAHKDSEYERKLNAMYEGLLNELSEKGRAKIFKKAEKFMTSLGSHLENDWLAMCDDAPDLMRRYLKWECSNKSSSTEYHGAIINRMQQGNAAN